MGKQMTVSVDGVKDEAMIAFQGFRHMEISKEKLRETVKEDLTEDHGYENFRKNVYKEKHLK